MRVLAATIFPLLFLALARILLDAYYQYIDRPELFAQNQSQDLLFNGMLWLVLTLVILWFMGIQVRVQLAVPVTVSIAIALWSLTIDVSPEHRDWDEKWFGLAFVGVPISIFVTLVAARLDDFFRKPKVKQTDGATKP